MLMVLVLLSPLQSCTGSDITREKMDYKVIPEIRDVRPDRPIKIKLKRNAKGSYSWELTGEDVDRLIEIDRKLRESIIMKTDQ
jgi:hypothetical protein